MRNMLTIFLCAIGISVYAVDYAPFASSVPPSAAMQSVNNSGYMTVGSSYSSDVYAVGSYSPSSAPAAGPRKAPPSTGGESGYDPNNPQFAPLGDALLPLLLMALAFTGLTYLRKSKITHHKSQITNDK